MRIFRTDQIRLRDVDIRRNVNVSSTKVARANSSENPEGVGGGGAREGSRGLKRWLSEVAKWMARSMDRFPGRILPFPLPTHNGKKLLYTYIHALLCYFVLSGFVEIFVPDSRQK